MKSKTTAPSPARQRLAGRCARPLAGLLAAAALLSLAACGGSSSRVDEFHPTRIVAFGDELSLLGNGGSAAEPLGSKYTINVVDSSTGVLACASQPIWVQSLASAFRLVFAECNSAGAAVTGVMRAALNARVADVEAQYTTHAASETLKSTHVVTVMAGLHDVLDAYVAFDNGSLTRAQALAQVGAAGSRLGALVNRMAAEGSGGRVIYATMPDLGLSPYALQQKAAKTDIDRQQLLIDLSARFNEALRLAVINDGRYVGLVTAEEQLQVMARYPSSYGLTNAVDAACDVSQYDGQGDSETSADQAAVYSAFAQALPATQQVIGCSTLTLASAAAASVGTYLWADDLRPSPAWQVRVGAAAVSRALTNPF